MLVKKSLRVTRLFRDNDRSLAVAMDHPRAYNTITALKDANAVIRTVIGAGADAILVPPGTAARAAGALGKGGMWLSVESTLQTVSASVETALRLGADGIKIEVYPWTDRDKYPDYSSEESIWYGNLLNANCMAAECQKWGIPLIGEVVPGGWRTSEMRTPEKIAAASRVVSEFGVDYVKTFYTGDKESFREVVDNCQVPVLVLGGAKVDSDRDVLAMVRDAMDAGASGIMMGRNIWDHDNVAGMTAALAAIIHEDASVDDAYKLVR